MKSKAERPEGLEKLYINFHRLLEGILDSEEKEYLPSKDKGYISLIKF